MARKTALVKAAAKIGTVVGTAERVARDLGQSARQKEFAALKREARALARLAERLERRLKRAAR